jgi:dTDP-4-amino-4,6-dideoxygalactose transaminase
MTVFIRPRLYWIPASLPFLGLGQTVYPKDIRVERLSGLQAGLLRHWESRLVRANRERAETAADLSRHAPGTLARRVPHPYLRLPLLARSAGERAEMHAESEREGLGLSVAYPSPVNEIPEIRQMFEGQQFPAAARVAERLLTAPTHHWLSASDRHANARVIAR